MTESRVSSFNDPQLERRIVPGLGASQPQLMTGPVRTQLFALSVTTLLIGVALAVGLVIEHLLRLPNILLVFLPVVLFAAVRFGLVAASWACVLSIMATSFFLAPPLMSFAVSDASNVWALTIFLAVAIVTSSLAAQVRQRAAAADRHARIVEALYEFGSKLGAISDENALLHEAARKIQDMLHASVVLLVPQEGLLRTIAVDPQSAELPPQERRAAEWCWSNGQPSGRGTGNFHGVRHLFLPLDAGRGTVGVIGLLKPATESLMRQEEARLLDTLVHQVAINLERAHLAQEMHRSEMLAATEKLRSALLMSISHDLKTPLASILGNVTGLLRYGHLYDDRMRTETLAAMEEETRRLSLFVDNLLHMTRIDAGALRPTLEPVDLSDLIGSALKRVEKPLRAHHVRTALSEDLPMIALDFVLAEQVLVNVLENAGKFAPAGTDITISACREGGEVVIRIGDEGPGIPEADLPRVFDRFFRAPAGDHRPAGVGLGLAVCKGFVEAMGGVIRAGNRETGTGVVITIRFSDPAVEHQA